MAQIEINPKQTFAELKIMQERERSRLITEALAGRELSRVQRRQLEIELENNTRFVEGELTPIDDSGAVLRDDHGWPVSTMDFIKNTAANMFKQSTPAAQAPQQMTADEFFQQMKAAKTNEERILIAKSYREQT